MRTVPFTYDHDCGCYPDSPSAHTRVYEDTGLTLAQEFPEYHFQVPLWIACLWKFSDWLHGFSRRLVAEQYEKHLDSISSE